MNENAVVHTDDRTIMSARGGKNRVDPLKPYGWMVEKERTHDGKVEDTAIIFLTNRECPFRCLMCDLWRNTTDSTVPAGAIAAQIEWALDRLPPAQHLKLYNSGSFFDPGAIPTIEYNRIAALVRGFRTVIVESHPRFINDNCLRFRDMTGTGLQIAIGLETVNEEVLRRLNKQMSVETFGKAVKFLTGNDILTRAFILLRPPFMSEEEGIFWAERSIDFAFEAGAECCTVIPVRPGNGIMEVLMAKGLFETPEIGSLEEVCEYGIRQHKGRIFADTWDLQLFSRCDSCFDGRIARLAHMNLHQEIPGPVRCDCKY